MRLAFPRLALAGLLVTLPSCGSAPDLSPPQIRLDEQECDRCRMLISDERFAAALVFERDGQVTKLAYDDINCLFAHLAEQPVAGAHTIYTHDMQTRAWLDARAASFVRSEKLETPMASQVGAAAGREAAQRLLERFPGELLTFEDVARRFTRSPRGSSHTGGDPQ